MTSTSHATVRPFSAEIVLPSVRQNAGSRKSARYRSTIAATPLSLPSSSSAVPRKSTSRSSGRPDRLSSSIVTSWQMAVPFMSVAPRPQMNPSRMSPENGGTVQRSPSAGTTSRWLSRRSGRIVPFPGSRARMFARPLPRS